MKLPIGYRFATTYCGLRKVKKDDLALIVSDRPAAAAAVYTTNRVQASPIKLAKKNMAASRGTVSAVLVNAGNANCATRTGDKVALECAKAVAKLGKVPVAQVIPASTGVIGVEMDASLVTGALPVLFESLAAENFEAFAEAIMTTDLVPKTAVARVGPVTLAGATKGSGMIHPNMATTLGFVFTDAAIPAGKLKKMLSVAVNRSYNRISVDGDMSTNDILLVTANGAAGKLTARQEGAFGEALTLVTEDLARQIARDGEGARKLITIDVTGAANDDAAQRIARAIANSPLVKTAIAGSDANWGRILCAAGYSGAAFEPGKVDIKFQGVTVCKSGLAAEYDEPALIGKLNAKECRIEFRIKGAGKGRARFWTCDLTEKYIEINGSYRT